MRESSSAPFGGHSTTYELLTSYYELLTSDRDVHPSLRNFRPATDRKRLPQGRRGHLSATPRTITRLYRTGALVMLTRVATSRKSTCIVPSIVEPFTDFEFSCPSCSAGPTAQSTTMLGTRGTWGWEACSSSPRNARLSAQRLRSTLRSRLLIVYRAKFAFVARGE